jgi:GNAT superfamily N-acetyltransferase
MTLVVRELTDAELELVDRHLPLNRLEQQRADGSTYLVAWVDAAPVGHAHIAWSGTTLDAPELQDVFVLPELRRRGIATQLTVAAEEAARARGAVTFTLSVSLDGNPSARRLYEQLGYSDAGIEPVPVTGTIMLRGEPFDVDDTLLYLTKQL